MVVTSTITTWRVQKVLIDQGSSADVVFWSTFLRLQLPPTFIKSYLEPLLGFVGERVRTIGYVDLLTTFGIGSLYRVVHFGGSRYIV